MTTMTLKGEPVFASRHLLRRLASGGNWHNNKLRTRHPSGASGEAETECEAEAVGEAEAEQTSGRSARDSILVVMIQIQIPSGSESNLRARCMLLAGSRPRETIGHHLLLAASQPSIQSVSQSVRQLDSSPRRV